MEITTQHEVDPQEWDRLAASLGGGYFHCHAQAVYDARRSETDPLFAKAVDDAGACVGLAVGRVAAPRIWPFSRYSRQAILPCLPVTADGSAEAQRAVMEALQDHVRRAGVFAVEVTAYDSPQSEAVLSALGYALSERSEFYIDLEQDLDAIWSRFTPRRHTDIRKAERCGVVTRVENTKEALELVYSLYEASMDRRQIDAPPPAKERTWAARRDLLASGRVDVLVAHVNDAAVSATTFGCFNRRVTGLVSGSSEAGYKASAQAHVIWTAIQTYKQRGAVRLNLGAALPDQAGLFRFKRDFGAEVVSQPGGHKTISRLGSTLHAVASRLRGRP